ncbi:MAG: peptidyl-prolyl cis-trans isomerase [Deltaproteobacteria bacterium]|nr:peptidyl-prolyl cis-trans isomerase [Deltaproteobacteria bacterium]
MRKTAFRKAGMLLVLGLAMVLWGCGKPESGKKKGQTPAKAAQNKAAGRYRVPPCPEADKTKVVATVNGVKIMKCAVYNRIHRLSPYIRRRYTTLDRKKEFVDRMVRFEVLAFEAVRLGLDKDPDVQRAKKEVMVQKLSRKLFQGKFKPAEITEKELQDYYAQHKGDYNKPAMVRVSDILTKSKGEGQKILAEAKKLDVRAFRKLARDKSQDEATKMRGGDLRYFAKTDTNIAKPIVDAAFALTKRGDVTGPIKTKTGWHVICLTGKRRPINRSYQQVKQLLRNRILREKRVQARKQFVAQLKTKTKPFVVHEDQLSLVKVCKRPAGGLFGRIERHMNRMHRGRGMHMRPHRARK